MQKGKIILINGVSSSGKTTLSKILQARLPDQYFLLPGDILNEISLPKNSRSYHGRFINFLMLLLGLNYYKVCRLHLPERQVLVKLCVNFPYLKQLGSQKSVTKPLVLRKMKFMKRPWLNLQH